MALEWKPFHTAPHDGNTILVYFEYPDGKYTIDSIWWDQAAKLWKSTTGGSISQTDLTRAALWCACRDITPKRLAYEKEQAEREKAEAATTDTVDKLLGIADKVNAKHE
jgi:hypothetical protein